MGSATTHTTIGFIGAGPRSVGLVERLIANAPHLAPGTELCLVLIDPHPAGPGKIWRYDQSPSLMMNSLAEDVTMFLDETSTIEGPLVTGPTLDEWFERVREGSISFTPPDERVASELAAIGPKGFATRRLFSCYLRWCYEHVVSQAPETVRIREVAGTVERVDTLPNGEVLHYFDGHGNPQTLTVDMVVYALGHTDSAISPYEHSFSSSAQESGLTYWPSNYASEGNYDAIPAQEPVLLRGLGLSFIDLVVMLTLDRGGQVRYDSSVPAGSRATYISSGNEPRIFAGSGRGVPYRSKVTSSLHGFNPGMSTTFLTKDSLLNLLDSRNEVDFEHDIWPLIVKEMAFWHYREIFTGHPERVRASWDEAEALFHQFPAGAPELTDGMRDLVKPEDIFDIQHLDRPLDGVRTSSLHEFQDVLTDHIKRDISLREVEEHSETLAIFLATLACYVVIADSLSHPAWSVESRLNAIPRRWHNFFSYLDSGPPASRLELLLALMREGILTFVGGDIEISIDTERDAFVAGSPHQPETISAGYLVEAYHPERTVERSANPALKDIVSQCEGTEQLLQTVDGTVSTQRLHVDVERARVIRPDGSRHPRRFAVGDFTSGPPSAAFSRPRTNARIFRENDAIARELLIAATQLKAANAATSLTI